MQCKEETSSGARCMYLYIERVAQFLTPQCASSTAVAASFAGRSAGAMWES